MGRLITAHGRKPPAPPEFIGYARVSTDEQILDLQIDALTRAGCTQIYKEYISGTSKKRPELDMAIKELRPGDTLVVWRLDRLARSVTEIHRRLQQIEAQEAKFRSLNEHFDFSSATGRLALNVAAAFAEFERQITVERTIAGLARAKERGSQVGAPLQFTDDKRKLARKMLALKGRRSMMKKDIAEKLDISSTTLYGWIRRGMPSEAEEK